MLRNIHLNYEDVVRNEPMFIKYLTNHSDFFSLNVMIQKPYSQIPPVFHYDMQLQPFIIKYIYERKDWLVDFLGQRKHQIMVVCRCCKGSRKELLQMPNVFLPIENDLPEDICFYRNGKVWFATISHEKMAFFDEATNEDKQFLNENSICYHCE